MAKDKFQATRHSGGSTKSLGQFDAAEQARAVADAARARRHKGSTTWWTVDRKKAKG
jgi:hypothetical protein